MTKNKNIHAFQNLLLSDMRSELSFGKIMAMIIGGLIFPIMISYIGLFIGGPRGGQLASLIPLFINAVVFFSFQRVVGTVRDKASVDKNKAAYLYYDKNLVLATKVINESIMFLIGFFILISVGMIGAFAWPNNHFTFGEVATEAMLMLPGLFVLHIFIFMMAKWAMAFIPKRGIAIAAALGIALVLVTPVFIFNQISETSFLKVALNRGDTTAGANSWFADNQNIAIWIPYMNLGALTGVNDLKIVDANGIHHSTPLLDESWYIIVPIFMMIGIIAGTWRLQASAQKAYLAAS